MRPIRLVLLDDHDLFRESLRHLLAGERDFEVAGSSSTYSAGLDLLASARADLVLLDFAIEGKRSEGFIAAARVAGYQGKFLIVTAGMDVARSLGALKTGASGLFLKNNSWPCLAQAIRAVASGELWVDPGVTERMPGRSPRRSSQPLGELNVMEQSVISGLLEGQTSKEIGAGAGISASSVNSIVQHLFEKAGVRKRSQLVRVLLEESMALQRRSR